MGEEPRVDAQAVSAGGHVGIGLRQVEGGVQHHIGHGHCNTTGHRGGAGA